MDSPRPAVVRGSKVDLVPTGIDGLDAMLYGGIPKYDQVIISGGPGAGKTLMAFEFLYRNAKAGETGVFFTLEEDAKSIIKNAKSAFPYLDDIDALVESGKIIVSGRDITDDMIKMDDGSEFQFGHLVSELEDVITAEKATRVVVDSVSTLELIVRDQPFYRKSMWALVVNLRRLGVTSLLTSEITSLNRKSLSFKPEHFIFDGIVFLYQGGDEATRRVQTMEVIKMRGFRHSFITAPYDITPSGFKVFSSESVTT